MFGCKPVFGTDHHGARLLRQKPGGAVVGVAVAKGPAASVQIEDRAARDAPRLKDAAGQWPTGTLHHRLGHPRHLWQVAVPAPVGPRCLCATFGGGQQGGVRQARILLGQSRQNGRHFGRGLAAAHPGVPGAAPRTLGPKSTIVVI